MMGRKYVFTEKMDKYPKKVSLLPILIHQRKYPIIKSIITEGVLCIVENIVLKD